MSFIFKVTKHNNISFQLIINQLKPNNDYNFPLNLTTFICRMSLCQCSSHVGLRVAHVDTCTRAGVLVLLLSSRELIVNAPISGRTGLGYQSLESHVLIPVSYCWKVFCKMSAVTPPINDQYVFHRREFEQLSTENERRWHTPQPVHGPRTHTAPHQLHRVKQKYIKLTCQLQPVITLSSMLASPSCHGSTGTVEERWSHVCAKPSMVLVKELVSVGLLRPWALFNGCRFALLVKLLMISISEIKLMT